ncbi:MAG: repeat-containing protein [Chloroflexi bacterium]|nr:repeat-containing protein [Chloroflexota bacterium]
MAVDPSSNDSEMLAALAAFIPIDRRRAMAKGAELPAVAAGAALFADISGFTPLTETLVRALGPQRGAEELTHFLNRVYDALVAELYLYGGSVIYFSGDAITCWLDGDDGRRAIACGLAMQRAMTQFAAIPTPGGEVVSLAVKAAVAAGAVRRFVVGDPAIQLIDVVAGRTLERIAAAERVAQKGDVVVDAATAEALGALLTNVQWRIDEAQGDRVAVVASLAAQVDPNPWPIAAGDVLQEHTIRQWLLPAVYQRLRAGSGEFLAELRPAVVLFLRFSGLDFEQDETVAGKLDAYIRWIQGIFSRLEGTLLQLIIGDKGSYLYGAFGAPLAHEDDDIRAVSAAFELASPPEEFAHVGVPAIGISRGRMRTGAYGARDARTYGVLGDETNMAARLMQAAAPGQILVSDAVQQAAAGIARFERLPPLRVKGKSKPVTVYTALDPIDHRTLRLREPRYTLPMVGREAELDVIAQRLALAHRGNGQLVGVTAEAGMGKSRLVAEAIRLAQEQSVVAYGGECQSYGSTVGYHVWQGIWRGLFGLEESWTVEQQIAALEAALVRIDPALLPRVPLLGTVLNLSVPDSELTRSFDAKLRKSSLEALLVDCLQALAARSPLLLVLEDCHWIDALSQDLVEALGRAAANLPVIMVLSYRPSDSQDHAHNRWESLPHFTEIRLNYFSAHEAGQLIQLKLAQLDGAHVGVPAELVERITARADGNPFYIEELINYIRDRGIDPRDSAAIERLELPTSLHSLILSRIDRLGERQKVVLKVASILGRRVQADWLSRTYRQLGDTQEVRACLDSLSTVDLLPLDQPEPDLVYIFKHVVTQEVAYESLPYAQRATLHAQFGRFIEDTYGETLDQYVSLLAFHYERTEDLDKKCHYLLRAGEASQAAFANATAVGYYRRLLALLSDAARAPVLFRLGQVMDLMGDWSEADDLYRQALDLAMRGEDRSGEATGLRALGWLRRKQGKYQEAAGYLTQAHTAFEQMGDLAEVSQVSTDIGEVARQLGAYAEAKTWYEQGLRLAESQGEAEQFLRAQALALKGAGTLANQQGERSTARALYERSLALYQEIGDRPAVAVLLNNVGVAIRHQGDYDAARAMTEESLAVFREIGDRWSMGQLLNNLGCVAGDMGDYPAARRLLEESLTIRRQLGDRGGLALSLNSLGDVLLDEGEHAAARPLLVESLSINWELGDRGAVAYLLDDFAALATAEAQAGRALILAGAAAAAHEATGAALSQAERERFDRLLQPARRALADQRAGELEAAGRAMQMQDAVAFALAVEHDSKQGPEGAGDTVPVAEPTFTGTRADQDGE